MRATKTRTAMAAACVGAMVLAGVGSVPASAGELSLTVYSSADAATFDPQGYMTRASGRDLDTATGVPGFGVVRDTRELELTEGVNTIKFADVAQFIDPTTVSLTDLSPVAAASEAQAVRVVEQSFRFDLVSNGKLLDQYIDRPITLVRRTGPSAGTPVTATLLARRGSELVLQTPAGLWITSDYDTDFQLGALPDGPVTRPTLVWQLWSPSAGKRNVQASYQADGLTWRADYTLAISHDNAKADLSAWVTLLNLSGASYPDTKLKLVAGNVKRINQEARSRWGAFGGSSMFGQEAILPFESKSLFEYHLYTLPRRVTVAQNITQQIALFPTVRGVDVVKRLVCDYNDETARITENLSPREITNANAVSAEGKKAVQIELGLANTEANKLGMPLPGGRVRVYKMDAPDTGSQVKGDGAMEFVGEDTVGHTARNGTVWLRVGQAFDVVSERTQTGSTVDDDGRVLTESFRMVIRNAKKQSQPVVVRERMFRGPNWVIVRKTDDFTRTDSRTVQWDVDVPAEGEKRIEYTVKYTW